VVRARRVRGAAGQRYLYTVWFTEDESQNVTIARIEQGAVNVVVTPPAPVSVGLDAEGAVFSLDDEGNIVYFVPELFVSADETTGLIEYVDLRWFTWEPATNEYELIEVSGTELPLFGDFGIQFSAYGSDSPTGERATEVGEPAPDGTAGRFVSPAAAPPTAAPPS
jgi:hypothetical protein